MNYNNALRNGWRPLQNCNLSLFHKQKQWKCRNLRGDLVQLILLGIFIDGPSRIVR